MAKRLNRIDMHKRICTLSGVSTKSKTGYATRREMMELMVYLERVNHTFKDIIATNNSDIISIIKQGNVLSWNENNKV